MLHAVIFDVDGTLIDSVDLHAKRSSDLRACPEISDRTRLF